MEALLNWLLGSLSWDVLKRIFARRDAADLKVLRRALKDAQDRNHALAQVEESLERVVEQRNLLGARLIEANRRIVELEQECVALRTAATKKTKGKRP